MTDAQVTDAVVKSGYVMAETNPSLPVKAEKEVAEITELEVEQQLPKPVGYRLLIALPRVEEQYESGLLKADSTKHAERVLSMMGAVIDMGEQAYADKDRFPNGPWCKVGDFVMFRPNSGTRFKANGQEYRLLNDDSIEAVVADPRGVTRA
jgi:co-chaperonin GroES (HSP10)